MPKQNNGQPHGNGSLISFNNRLNSPDGKLEVTLYIGDRITYELTEEGHTLVAPSPLSVHLDNRTVWGNGSHLKSVSHRQANEVIPSPSTTPVK